MKKIAIITILLFSITTSQSQSLAIGAKMPDLKNVEWISDAPKSTKTLYIDFYQSRNQSSCQNLEKIKALHREYPHMKVVILTREDNESIRDLAEELGEGFSVGYDATGEVYRSFGVRFVPFSMIFDSRGSLLWQGNVAQLSKEILNEL